MLTPPSQRGQPLPAGLIPSPAGGRRPLNAPRCLQPVSGAGTGGPNGTACPFILRPQHGPADTAPQALSPVPLQQGGTSHPRSHPMTTRWGPACLSGWQIQCRTVRTSRVPHLRTALQGQPSFRALCADHTVVQLPLCPPCPPGPGGVRKARRGTDTRWTGLARGPTPGGSHAGLTFRQVQTHQQGQWSQDHGEGDTGPRLRQAGLPGRTEQATRSPLCSHPGHTDHCCSLLIPTAQTGTSTPLCVS